MPERFLGIDIGAETLKVVELARAGDDWRWSERRMVEHHKAPGRVLLEVLAALRWEHARGAAVTGRFGRMVNLPRVPAKQAEAAGFRFLHGDGPATVVSIGSHGFSVLELRASNTSVLRENTRCSQGTGNFLRQLVERFGLTVEEASELCASVEDPAPLSGRCPVILKTDMTHLANKGESRARILAGLYDAVCENVQVLVKPRLSPPRITLIGGVTRSARIREHFRRFLSRNGMELAPWSEDGLFCEALGAALAAAERPKPVPPLTALLAPAEHERLERIPALSSYLARVRRMPAVRPVRTAAVHRRIMLGFDIGSTGSKVVALDPVGSEPVWQGYRSTGGDPVGAAQALAREFLEGPVGTADIVGLGVTGSGREIVGSLLKSCYGSDSTFVLNEIAAHATGALHYDPRVDTIFEIGGQDAKYIRLSGGRVVDAAMNEACSAGTGSFIEEQGRRFAGIRDIVHLAETALAAPEGVSLGQHCSVFMAEIIDEASAAGVEPAAVMAGIYDSVVQNYLNRVKGPRSVGQVVFCQGMPFASPALAAAVARQTGGEVVIPPDPGTVGALGIALLAVQELAAAPALDLRRFLEARVEEKDAFVCRANKGCGGSGNKCRIDRLKTVVGGARGTFLWGGACSLYDAGAGRRKLPDRAPDPFREREELAAAIVRGATAPRGRPRIALTDEFQLKSMAPFFVTFLRRLGFDPVVLSGGDQQALKRGIEKANVPFCAPMQQYHGLVQRIVEDRPEFVFLPLLRNLPFAGREPYSKTCPVVQGSPDIVRTDLGLGPGAPRVLSPVIDIGPGNLVSGAFVASCRRIAADLVASSQWRHAYREALDVQRAFERDCVEAGRRALEFCRRRDVLPVAVLGRAYTIHNTVLNSNVPAILREQGAIPVPVDCLPLPDDTPVFEDMYWGYGQQNLRAAHAVRRTPGLYSVFCSNYSCGPDSFNIHFYSHIMQGKPFAIIETDGHSGDAGTKTRVEAFLYCVREDRKRSGAAAESVSLVDMIERRSDVTTVREKTSTVLVPRMSESAEAVSACMRGLGLRVEVLPYPDREALRLGRRHTSGKECVPLCLTLGSMLQRIQAAPRDQHFTILMPTASGPCRFGMYQLLQKIVVDRLGYGDRVDVWSPHDTDYFADGGTGFAALAFAAVMTNDMIRQAFYETRPVERAPGLAQRTYDQYIAELLPLLERRAARGVSFGQALVEAFGGRLFGCADLLRRAAMDFARARRPEPRPTVLLVGEIYVRCDDFANDFVIDKLEARGITVRTVGPNEWFEYTAGLNAEEAPWNAVGPRITDIVQRRIQDLAYGTVAAPLDWNRRTTVREILAAARPLLRDDLQGEACLTLGGALHAWRAGEIDGAVSVGPLECMPNKLAESQFFHAAESDGLVSLTLGLNGDPVDPELLDRFAYDVHARFRQRQQAGHARPHPVPVGVAAYRPELGQEVLPIENS